LARLSTQIEHPGELTSALHTKGAIRNRRCREAGDILHLTRAD
jgi:hypothetical protein